MVDGKVNVDGETGLGTEGLSSGTGTAQADLFLDGGDGVDTDIFVETTGFFELAEGFDDAK